MTERVIAKMPERRPVVPPAQVGPPGWVVFVGNVLLAALVLAGFRFGVFP